MHHQESHSLESRLLWLHICSCSGGPFSNFYRSRLHLLRWGSKLPGIQAHPKVLAGCGWITPSPPSPWQQQTLICMYFQGGGEADARPSSVENAGWKLVNSIIQKIINSKVLEIDSDGGDLGAAERIAAVFSHKYWYRRFIWQAITLHIRRMADVEVISFVAVKACSAAYYIAAATDYIMVSRWVSYIQKSHSVCLCVFVCVFLQVGCHWVHWLHFRGAAARRWCHGGDIRSPPPHQNGSSSSSQYSLGERKLGIWQDEKNLVDGINANFHQFVRSNCPNCCQNVSLGEE